MVNKEDYTNLKISKTLKVNLSINLHFVDGKWGPKKLGDLPKVKRRTGTRL